MAFLDMSISPVCYRLRSGLFLVFVDCGNVSLALNIGSFELRCVVCPDPCFLSIQLLFPPPILILFRNR